MSAEKIISAWKKQQFKPVYWLEGEENYFIDKVMNYAETSLLSPDEASFNLSVFYGKDSSWPDIVNACMRYPMFGDKQVVLLKEGQQMRDLEKLENYIANPLNSTIFIVAHKDKKIDGRSKLAKILKSKAEVLTTKKMYENQLPEWTNELVQSKGFSINKKALFLIIDHIGSDLSRIENEIDKVIINLGNRKEITEDDVETYVGISKEFNIFELQSAIAHKNLPAALKIIQYFGGNPKAGPIQMVLPALYMFYSKVYMVFGVNSSDEKVIAAGTGITPYFIKDYILAAKNYGLEGIQKILLLLHEYNLRNLGIRDGGTPEDELMKEMVYKMIRND